ncbi:MAG: response regulator transcription factor [Alistipes sp.]|nr:response regulator transcription factor [Alistipes sp.]
MILKALIIEDEALSRTNLTKALSQLFDDIEVVGTRESVNGTVEFLKNPENRVDMIFMDVELADGMCFDIFDRVKIEVPVIITTAYDNYAIRAFRVNSIDYLLKPLDHDELRQAVERCRKVISGREQRSVIDADALREALMQREHAYKRRFVIRIGDRISVVNAEDIAYFYAEDKSTYIMTFDGKHYIVDLSLDSLSESVDPDNFFRISRSCIVSIKSIVSISKHLNNRLKLVLQPKAGFDVFVSRFRSGDFMDWLEEK